MFIQKGDIMPRERIKIFNKMYQDTWKELLPSFKEFSFKEGDLDFALKVDMESTVIEFQEKMFLELYKSFNNRRNGAKNFLNQKKVIIFLDNNQIILKTIPSFAFSVMQELMVSTLFRLDKEKSERVEKTRLLLIEMVGDFLLKKEFSLEFIKKNFKITSWYKKGEYSLKIVRNKKIKNNFNKEEIKNNFNFLKIKLNIDLN